MSAGSVIGIGLRTLAVCFLFALSFAIGTALSGVAEIARTEPSQQISPGQFLLPFATVCLCAGIVVSYLILRSSWRGLKLAGAMFAATYGISTIATQIEAVFFLSTKMPHGMIRALFVQGAITMALIAPLAILVLGKWRAAPPATTPTMPIRLSPVSRAWRIALLVLVFVFLYMFFGYYIAWRNPILRQYYGGHEFASFIGSLKSNLADRPSIYGLQVFRALLYVAFLFPLLRMLAVSRWEKAAAVALFLAAWTTILLLPNALMPASVARSHFWETLAFNLTFGALLAWLLSESTPSTGSLPHQYDHPPATTAE